MKKQNIKYSTRSLRINTALYSKAKKQNMNLNRFIEEKLREFFDGNSNCPTCGQKVLEKNSIK